MTQGQFTTLRRDFRVGTEQIDVKPSYDLGHLGDFDYTQITKMQSMTPERRWQRFKRWRRLLKRSNSMSPILDDIVSRFAKHQVEFVIVGGVSAVLQGAAVNTFDLDICYRRTPENIAKLVAALKPLGPLPRGFPKDLPFVFDERTIQLGSNFTFDVGEEDLDLLGTMSAIGGYEEIIQGTVEMEILGFKVKVLSLEQLIATKEAAGRQKDLLALPLIKAALAIKQQTN